VDTFSWEPSTGASKGQDTMESLPFPFQTTLFSPLQVVGQDSIPSTWLSSSFGQEGVSLECSSPEILLWSFPCGSKHLPDVLFLGYLLGTLIIWDCVWERSDSPICSRRPVRLISLVVCCIPCCFQLEKGCVQPFIHNFNRSGGILTGIPSPSSARNSC